MQIYFRILLRFFFSRESCHIQNYFSDNGEFLYRIANNWQLIYFSSSRQELIVLGDLEEMATRSVATAKLGEYYIGQKVSEDQYHTIRMLAFMNSKYVDKTMHSIPRSIRRRNSSITRDVVMEVTTLRRRDNTGNSVDREHKNIQWKHSWWVNGHYKAQWYPKRKTHKLKYIAPYFKGDPSLPILRHIYKVDR